MAAVMAIGALCGQPVCHGQAGGASATIEVNASGVGVDADAAEKQALIGAVSQAVGAYIDNETLVKN